MNVLKFIWLVLGIVIATNVSANHVLGGNISYDCLGGDQYLVRLTFYKDCFGATPAPATENIFFIPQTACGSIAFSAPFELVSVTEISDLCPSELANSSCNGGFNPGTELVVYEQTITLNPGCVWDISWGSGDWNYFVNMDNSLLPNAYIATTIDTNFPCTNSVEISSQPVPYNCSVDAVTHALSFDNPDGLDLVVTMIDPQVANGIPAPYEVGYDSANPIPGITFDPVTYEITFPPAATFGNYVIAFQIEMYDASGNLVGVMTETMSFVIQLCDSLPTYFTTPPLNDIHPDVTSISATELEVCVGDSLCFDVEAVNDNLFRQVTITSANLLTEFPGATVTDDPGNPAELGVCIVPDQTAAGVHVVDFYAVDDACINPDDDNLQVTITVLESLSVAFTDSLMCFGESIVLEAFGDDSFTWDVLSGTANPGIVGNGGSQNITPESDMVIQVTSDNAPPQCSQTEFINLEVALSDLTGTVTDESCAQDDGQIVLSVTSGAGPFSYNWPADATAGTTISNLDEGSYTVTVTDNGLPGCERTETYLVGTTPPPTGSISGDVTICAGEIHNIPFTLTGVGPFSATVNGNNYTGLSDGDVIPVAPATTTTYTLTQVTDGNAPPCTYVTPSSLTVTVRELPNATLTGPANVCDGETADLILNITPTATTLDLTSGDAAFTGPFTDGDIVTVTPTLPSSTYDLTGIAYTDAPTCAQVLAESLTVNVDPLPTATIAAAGNGEICAGDAAVLEISLTGTGPWEITYTAGGVVQPVVTSATALYNLIVTPGPLANTEYCVTQVLDQGTNCSAAVTSCATVIVNSLPGGTFLDDITLCTGEGFDLEFDLTGNGPFTVLGVDPALVPLTIANPVADGDLINVAAAQAGDYCILTITDDNGCESNPVDACATVTLNALPDLALAGTEIICEGDNFDYTFAGLTGTGPFDVDWSFYTVAGDVLVASGTENNILDGHVLTLSPTEDSYLVIDQITDSGAPVCSNVVLPGQLIVQVNTYSQITLLQDMVLCQNDLPGITLLYENFTGPALTVDLSTGQTVSISDALLNVDDTYDFVPMYDTSVPGSGVISISDYTDAGNPCTSIAVDEITVDVIEIPTASMVADGSICPGEVYDLEVTTPATGGPFEIVIGNDAGDPNITQGGLNGVQTIGVTPTATTTYTLVSVEETGSGAGCSSVIGQSVTVTVFNPPSIVGPVDTLCANTGDSFQLSFEINGGDPGSFSVTTLGGVGGTISAGPPYIYTSDAMPDNTGDTWLISDASGCPAEELVFDPYDCPILTFAGTVDPTPVVICDGGTFCITQNGDEVLDANDVISYAILDNCDFAAATVLDLQAGNCWDAGMDLLFPPFNFGQEYYVVAIAGDDDGTGLVNLASAFLDVSDCMPVTIQANPTATLSGGGIICENESATLTITLSGQGPWDVTYTDPVAGDVDLMGINPADGTEEIEVSNAGLYTLVSVTTALCPGTTFGNATVTVNPLPTATLSAGGNICDGQTYDFTIDLTGAGNWDFDITIDQGAGPVVIDSYTGVAVSPVIYTASAGGTYSITSLSDGNGCASTSDSNAELLVINTLPTLTWSPNDFTTCTGTDLIFDLNFSGEPDWTYEYLFNGAASGPITTSNASETVAFPLPAPGDYDFEATFLEDGNGCQATLTESFTVTVIPPPVADAGLGAAVCSEEDVLIGSAPQAGIDYSWSVDTGVVDDLLNNTGAAQPTANVVNTDSPNVYDYTFTVSAYDPISDCTTTDDVVITVNPEPTADAGLDANVCFNQVYTLQGGGDGTCTWDDNGWLNPADLALCTPNTLPLTNTATFNLTVESAAGCIGTAAVTLTVADDLTQVADFDPQVCFEECTASIEITPTGGWGGYVVSGDLTSLDNEDLCSGTYDYTVTDAEGCTIDGSVVIDELPEYFINDVTITQPNCFGESSGEVEIDATDAVEFTLNTESSLNNNFDNLPAGDYDITATNLFGCVADTTVTLTENSGPIDIFTNFESTVNCVGDLVIFEATASGGAEGFIYNWHQDSPPPGPVYAQGSPLDVTLDEELLLYVVAYDLNGCASDTLAMEANFDTPVTVDAFPSQETVICIGECVEINAITGGGSGPIELTWEEFGLFSNDPIGNESTYTMCPEETSTYIVFADDGCAPIVNDSVYVTVNQAPLVSFDIDTLSGCLPLTVNFTNESDFENNTCFWNFGDGTVVTQCEDITYTYTVPGNYTPALTMTNEFGCTTIDSLLIPVEVYGFPEANFTWYPNPVTTLENEVDMVNLTQGAEQYEWDVEFYGSFLGEELFLDLPPVDLSTYQICLMATNEFGCTDTICQVLEMESVLLIHVPNAFTPDNDGVNDIFIPEVLGVNPDTYVFRIWNRWGELIYETDNLDLGWDGTGRDQSTLAPDGVYVWQIEAEDLNGGIRERYFGNVTLIR